MQRAGSGMGKERFSGAAEPALSDVAAEPQQGDFSCPMQLRADSQRHLQCLLRVRDHSHFCSEIFPSLINAVLVLTVSLPYLSHLIFARSVLFCRNSYYTVKRVLCTQTHCTGRRQQPSRL